jgi:tripartite-type tricarboxylate transporter receptor subunit TctC
MSTSSRAAASSGLAAFVAASFLAALSGAPARAQSVEQFYKGRTITMSIAAAPGGVNDLASRLVAQHLGRFIPGAPTIVSQNLPGASGIVGANRMYNSVEKDGSVIAILDRGAPQLAILGDRNAKYDPVRFTWLGSISSYANDAYVVAVNASNPARTVDDLKKAGVSITLGGMNPGTTNLTFATIAREVLGLNVRVVRGYTGAAPMFLAMQNGELDGQVVGLSSLKAGQPAMWAGKKVRVLIQFGRATRLPELADVPTGRELARDADSEAIIEFAEQPFFAALPYIAPPGVPPDRAKALQDAFMAMTRDPAFIEDARRLSLDVSPIDGDAVRALVEKSAKTPKSVIDRYNRIIGN